MSGSQERGGRVEISQLEHSPASTRKYAALLLGRHGVVAEALMFGQVALVKLDGEAYDLPMGCRRWAVHWADLRILEETAAGDGRVSPSYRVGVSFAGNKVLQHAVDMHQRDHEQDDKATGPYPRKALCGERVESLPVCGWTLRFTPVAAGTCRICAELVAKDS